MVIYITQISSSQPVRDGLQLIPKAFAEIPVTRWVHSCGIDCRPEHRSPRQWRFLSDDSQFFQTSCGSSESALRYGHSAIRFCPPFGTSRNQPSGAIQFAWHRCWNGYRNSFSFTSRFSRIAVSDYCLSSNRFNGFDRANKDR